MVIYYLAMKNPKTLNWDRMVKKNGNGKKICVIGLGYIGLPTASMLAIHGFNVIGVDINEKRVKEIKELSFRTTEKDLMTLVKGAINSGNLKVQTKPDKADVFIICVPTPCIECNGEKKCDLSYLDKAIENINPYLEDGNLIIIESTIPPGKPMRFTKSSQRIRTSMLPIVQREFCQEIY